MNSNKEHKRNNYHHDDGSADRGLSAVAEADAQSQPTKKKKPGGRYRKKLAKLQIELAYLQAWVKSSGARIVIIFEGRDAAGKGGVIKRIVERLSPRVFRVVALPAPTDREKSQIYMQRYIHQLPAAGEVVIFDRSWYNRPGVERVMGFCSEKKARRFLELAPRFEAAIVESGITLLKYFLDVSEEEQEKRFRQRIDDPLRQWKLSPMDIESYRRWWDYTRAYNEMIRATDTEHAPWWIVPSDDKERARVNCIAHLLSSIPYQRVEFQKPKLGKRQKRPDDFVEDAYPRRVVPEVLEYASSDDQPVLHSLSNGGSSNAGHPQDRYAAERRAASDDAASGADGGSEQV